MAGLCGVAVSGAAGSYGGSPRGWLWWLQEAMQGGVMAPSATSGGVCHRPRLPVGTGWWRRGAVWGLRPVELAQHQADLLEGRPLLRVLGPAPLHQVAQLLQVTLQGQRGPEGGLLAPSHTLDDLCAVRGQGLRGRWGGECRTWAELSRRELSWRFQGSPSQGLGLVGTAWPSHLWG